MRRTGVAATVLSLAAASPALADPYGRVLAPYVDGGVAYMSSGTMVLCANGHAMTGGWSSVIPVIPPSQSSLNGMYSVTVEGYAPSGMQTQAITPYATNPIGWPKAPSDAKTIRFIAADNQIIVPVGTGTCPSGGNTGSGKTQ